MINYKQVKILAQHDIEKLSAKVAKSLFLEDEVALALVYNEWDKVEYLFHKYKKVKTVHQHLMHEIDGCYRGYDART